MHIEHGENEKRKRERKIYEAQSKLHEIFDLDSGLPKMLYEGQTSGNTLAFVAEKMLNILAAESEIG